MSVVPLKESEIAAIPCDDLYPGMEHPGDDVVHTEGIITAWDGLDLFWQSWEPNGEIRGVIALMHGFGEHSARYHHVATMFVRAGYAVMAIDARGHGRSAGTRGYVEHFEEFPRDLDRLVAEVEKRWPAQHTVVFGHSHGGLIALHHTLMSPGRVAAYAVTSPYLALQLHVPLAKDLAGRLLSKVWGKFTMPTGLDTAILSHDEDVVKKYDEDPLILKKVTVRWFNEVLAAQEEVLERAPEVRAPFLFLVAGPDELVDSEASERVFHRLGSREREFELLPNNKHEVLNDPGWPDLVHRIVDWFERYR